MQARELNQQLANLFNNFPIEIIEAKASVQVVPQELKKVSSPVIITLNIYLLLQEKLVRALIEQQSTKHGDEEFRNK